jgi:putative FmdB family regulatory protein
MWPDFRRFGASCCLNGKSHKARLKNFLNMPTYEYQCLDCGYRVEYFQSMSEPAVTLCPQCKGHITRLVSAGAGLIFKGSGFYITDYKKSNDSNGSGTKGKPLHSESSSEESKPSELKMAETKTTDNNKSSESHHKESQ